MNENAPENAGSPEQSAPTDKARKRHVHLKPVEREAVRAAYRSASKVEDIARAFNISRGTVYVIVAGLPLRNPAKSALTKSERAAVHEQIRAAYLEGTPCAEIASACGVGITTVQKHVRDLPRRQHPKPTSDS